MVSRIAQIKKGDFQIPAGAKAVLWLDFQSASWRGFPFSEHLSPLFTFQGALNSGGFWNGCYGVKGLPLIENGHAFSERVIEAVAMTHDGRFYQESSSPDVYCGVVVSLPNETVFFERPNSGLSWQGAGHAFSRLRKFRIEKSWFDFPDDPLSERVEAVHKTIRRIAGERFSAP